MTWAYIAACCCGVSFLAIGATILWILAKD